MISAKNTHTKSVNPDEIKRGSSAVSTLASSTFSSARGLWFEENFSVRTRIH